MSSCEGKERFTTFAFAERIAKLSGRRNEGVRRQAYRCRECGAYHVGSTLERGRRVREEVLERDAA